MARYRVTLEYDGTEFAGWQVQPGLRTVQGEVIESIGKILGETIKVTGAGRTDAGVHAFGQVADFYIEKEIEPLKFLFSLNAVTPDDIAVKSLQEVEPGFNSRRDAKSRIYTYRIHVGPTAINRNYVWQLSYELDLNMMKEAAKAIIGQHDFSAFAVQKSLKEDNRCEVFDASWSSIGMELMFNIEANRFLHGMVRSLVGTFVEIGKGKIPVEDMERILNDGDYTSVGAKVPAKGLCLVKVNY